MSRLACVLSLAILLAGCDSSSKPKAPTPDKPRTTQAPGARAADGSVVPGDTVSVNYTGKLDDGTVFDTSLKRGGQPLEFVVGAPGLIKGFTKGVVGMKVGQKKTVVVPPEDGYGPSDPTLIAKVSFNELGPEAKSIKLGQVFGYEFSGGRKLNAAVTRIDADGLTLDANEKLAGKRLTFEIELLSKGR